MKILKKSTICFLTIIALTFAITACGGDDDPPQQAAPPTVVPEPRQDFSETIANAFGDKSVTIKGEQLTAGDWSDGKAKVLAGWASLNNKLPEGNSLRTKIIALLDSDFTIVIKAGDAAPSASTDKKTMIIGAGYLKANDAETIDIAMGTLINSNAFAMLKPSSGKFLAAIPDTPLRINSVKLRV